MWLASAFFHLTSAGSTTSAASSSSSLSFLSHALVPRALLVGTWRSSSSRRWPARSQQGTAAAVAVLACSRRFLADVAGTTSSSSAVGAGAGVEEGGSSMVPEDATCLLRSVYKSKPTLQLCVASTGSGGQALSWLLGVPGSSSCLLEVTVPYSYAAFDEKLAEVPPPSGYVSREAAEGLARDAYVRAVALCVAGSDRGARALLDKRVVGVGSTAAVVSSSPKRGLHRCFVCTQTAEGIAHYELNLAKGRRDRSGEDNAVSRVLLQAIAEAAGVTVPSGFKSDHLFLDTRGQADGGGGGGGICNGSNSSNGGGGGGANSGAIGDGQERPLVGEGEGEGEGTAGGRGGEEATEVVPMAELSPERDVIEELVSGRSSAALILPRGQSTPADASDASDAATSAAAATATSAGAEGAAASDTSVSASDASASDASAAACPAASASTTAAAVVLQDHAVKAALPRGATVILPGSFNPLHRGHIGLLEAARRLLSEKIQSEKLSGQLHGGQKGEGGVGNQDEDVDARRLGSGATKPETKVAAVHGLFELSVANADKGGMAVEEIRRRARQFGEAGGIGCPSPLLISRAPLFSQKARLFPGCAFVVGADTAKRVVDPKYYGNSQVEMVAALAEIRHLGCSFIVGGREDSEGVFLTLEGVLERSGLPESLRAMFHGLDESTFRENLSSTSIRASAGKASL